MFYFCNNKVYDYVWLLEKLSYKYTSSPQIVINAKNVIKI